MTGDKTKDKNVRYLACLNVEEKMMTGLSREWKGRKMLEKIGKSFTVYRLCDHYMFLYLVHSNEKNVRIARYMSYTIIMRIHTMLQTRVRETR